MSPRRHPPRILGHETEYAIVSRHSEPQPGQTAPPLTPAQCVDELFRGTSNQNRSRNRYLHNGGRLYVDVGSHPEYATAECSNARDVVLQDRAGEQILRDMLAVTNERLAEENIRIHILKTNTDSRDATFGCHENYQVARSTIDALDPGFISFLVTRPVLTGAGGIVNGDYVLSARAFHMHKVLSADPTRERPLIITREEAHADPTAFARLQLTFGDSNIAETTTELKLRLTSAVLDLLEDGGSLTDLELVDPIAALRDTSRIGAEAPIHLADGKAMTAIELQDTVLQRCEEHGTSDLKDVRFIVDSIQRGDHNAISSLVDWVCKRDFLTQAAQKYGVDIASPIVSRLQLAYHDIDPKQGMAERLRQAGNMTSLFTDEEITRACSSPPTDTRAALRGRFIAEAERLERMYSVSWTHIRLDSPPQPQIDLLDANSSEDSRVDELIEKMNTLPQPALSPLARLKAGLGPLY